MHIDHRLLYDGGRLPTHRPHRPTTAGAEIGITPAPHPGRPNLYRQAPIARIDVEFDWIFDS
ncbi:MAG: hypothetical protein JXB30_15965 [Anaerolineae bacterium]|nr:hypothetical protein [Anaerolineae bacterium]